MVRPGQRGLVFALLAVVLLAGAWWILSGGRRAAHATRRGAETHAGESDTDRKAETHPEVRDRPPTGELETAFATLQDALQRDDAHAAQAAAAALRRLLRRDDAARRRAEARLLAEETPRELRMGLALVLGTLPGGEQDTVLLDALERFAKDAAVVRCILFALGATRDPPDDDEIFGLGDRPWGVHGPGGLGITVNQTIADPAVRGALTVWLHGDEAAVREAAAIALRHTTHAAEVRGGFLAALGTEANDDVALVLGEALAVWAGGTAESAKRTEVVTALLARAAGPGLDGYRFRMENDFRRIALTIEHRALLQEYAHATRPFAVRSFALSALAGAAPRSGRDAVTEARGLLGQYLADDRDAAVRDLVARLLGTLDQDVGTIARLAAAARADPVWNVRFQALDALAGFSSDALVRATLRAATADADKRVAAHARELLDRLTVR